MSNHLNHYDMEVALLVLEQHQYAFQNKCTENKYLVSVYWNQRIIYSWHVDEYQRGCMRYDRQCCAAALPLIIPLRNTPNEE